MGGVKWLDRKDINPLLQAGGTIISLFPSKKSSSVPIRLRTRVVQQISIQAWEILGKEFNATEQGLELCGHRQRITLVPVDSKSAVAVLQVRLQEFESPRLSKVVDLLGDLRSFPVDGIKSRCAGFCVHVYDAEYENV